jgi:hypothetical protein
VGLDGVGKGVDGGSGGLCSGLVGWSLRFEAGESSHWMQDRYPSSLVYVVQGWAEDSNGLPRVHPYPTGVWYQLYLFDVLAQGKQVL